MLGFSLSPQFAAETAADLKTWMRDQGVDDRIGGGAGTNLLAGGQFVDVFVFDREERSQNRVMDLEPWDFIDLNRFGYATVADARAWFAQTGSSVTFNHYGTEIRLSDTVLSKITDDMILV